MYVKIIILTLIICLIAFIRKIIVNRLTYWRRNGVPQYSLLKILKETFDLLVQNKSQIMVFRQYRDVFKNNRYFGIYQLFQKFLVVTDVELIKKILVKDFDHFSDHGFFGQEGAEPLWDRNLFSLKGMEWKEMRMIINPTFTSRKMKIMFESSLTHAEQFVEHFQKSDKQMCAVVDVKDAMMRYFIDIIALLTFSYECNSLKDPDNEFYVNSKLVLPVHNFIYKVKYFLVFNFPRFAKYFGLGFYPKAGSDFFLNIMLKNMKEREKDGIDYNDVTQLLLKAKKNHNKNLTDIDLTSQAILLFFAGVDTVSNFMANTLYELARDVNVQKRLQEEVDKTIKICHGRITYFALFKMEYMHMVVSESLRKWSPTVTDRVCIKPYLIEPENDNENSLYLQKGDIVWIPIYSCQRNPDIYPNPDRFDPERFSKENKSSRHKYAYLPFGSGPRSCLAYRFAMMEMKLLIVYILSNFDILLLDNTMDPDKSTELTGLSILVDHLWLGFKSRTKVV